MDDHLDIERRLNVIAQQHLINAAREIADQVTFLTWATNGLAIGIGVFGAITIWHTYEIGRLKDAIRVLENRSSNPHSKSQESVSPT